MHILRRLALGLLSPLFIFLLFATAFDVGFVKTTTHPATVKKLISESGLYDSLVPAVLQQNKTIPTGLGDISATDPAIQKAVSSAVTPGEVKQNTEAAIDNIYQWLNGSISQPSFNIDFSASKNTLANNISAAVQQRLAALPACTTAQSLAIARSGQFDAVNASCLPRGMTAASAAELVRISLVGDNNFLDKSNINADSFKNDKTGQSVFAGNLKSAPKQYQRAKKTPAILILLTVLVGTGIVFLSRTRLTGIRHIGISLIIAGVLMLLVSWALNQVVSTKIVPKITVDNAVLQTDVRNLVTDVEQQVDRNYWFFGGTYTLLGVAAITASEVLRRRPPSRIPKTVTKPQA